MTYRLLRRTLISFVIAASLLTGCGTERDDSERDTAGESTFVDKYTPPERLGPPPEPTKSPPLEKKPAGTVTSVESRPEGIVADPETGIVALGLRDADELALVDGGSGEVLRKVKLSGSPRHLGLAAPGGPVLVPSESSDALIQVGLPGGGILAETPVDDFPHNVAGAPGGRSFVISESKSTAMVIEDDKVIEKFETPKNPGGVAIMEGGLVGIVSVRGLALEVFEADTLDSLGIIDAGEGPTHVKAGPNERFYVADTRGDAILTYETRPELRRISREALSGAAPYGLAVDLERNHLWVTLTAENRLVQYDIDGNTPREINSYPTVRQPNSVAVNPQSGRVFVAGRKNDELQIIDPQKDPEMGDP